VLDLRIGKNVPDLPERFSTIFPRSEERVAKAIALFGPNGSGKSTVLRALAFVSWFITESFQHKGPGLPRERFNDEESANRPIRLAIELGGPLDLSRADHSTEEIGASDEVGTFRYELHLQPTDGVIRTVSHEALRMKRKRQGKWQRVFEREAERKVQGSRTFPLSGFAHVVDKIREMQASSPRWRCSSIRAPR
jgi:hypothetical protein